MAATGRRRNVDREVAIAIMRQGTVRVSALCLAALAGAACSHGSSKPAATPAPAVREHSPLKPLADHHLHLASPALAEILTPTALPAVPSGVPEELDRLLRQRELKTGATARFVSDLYTKDAVIRARRGGGWVGGVLNIVRALNEYGPGYRLLPVAYDIRGATGYVAGYFARGNRYTATFQLSLRKEGEVWRIAVDNIIPNAPVMSPRPATAADLVSELDAAGIRYGVVLSVGYAFASPDYIGSGDEEALVRAENDWTSDQAAKYPDRLVAMCGVNPLKDYSVREVERCARLPRMVGVKLHFGNSRVALQNPEHVQILRTFFAAANRLRLPIVAHIEEFNGPAQSRIFLDQILPAAPDIPVQIAHMAGAGPGYVQDAAFEVLANARQAGDARMKNVFVDVASNVIATTSPEGLELIASRLREFGLDHVLFGSDRIPSVTNDDPATAWQSFRRLPLSEDEFRIVAGNLAPYLR